MLCMSRGITKSGSGQDVTLEASRATRPRWEFRVRHLIPCLLLLAGYLLLPGPAYPLRADDPPRPSPATVEAAQTFRAIERDWDEARKKYEAALGKAKSKAE